MTEGEKAGMTEGEKAGTSSVAAPSHGASSGPHEMRRVRKKEKTLDPLLDWIPDQVGNDRSGESGRVGGLEAPGGLKLEALGRGLLAGLVLAGAFYVQRQA